MSNYPQIEKLKAYFEKCPISFEQSEQALKEDYVHVILKLGNESFDLQVDNEYGDFDLNKPLVCLFLVLNSLETYVECTDFLDWCQTSELDASNSQTLSYYRTLNDSYPKIEKKLGKIDACISPLDYELGTGVVKTLLSL